jgi:DNA replication protein DnaC
LKGAGRRIAYSAPFDRQPKLNEKKIMAFYDSLTFMTQSQNIVWLGGTGIGKSGLATSFLIHAINQGYSGRYVLFAELLAQFYRSCADHSEAKLLSKYLSYDCLLIDEIGYVEVEAVQVGRFFTLMHKRHRKKPTLITSNLGFTEWGSFLKNAHLTAALIDRLTENSHIINMKQCVSLRPTQPRLLSIPRQTVSCDRSQFYWVGNGIFCHGDSWPNPVAGHTPK